MGLPGAEASWPRPRCRSIRRATEVNPANLEALALRIGWTSPPREPGLA